MGLYHTLMERTIFLNLYVNKKNWLVVHGSRLPVSSFRRRKLQSITQDPAPLNSPYIQSTHHISTPGEQYPRGIPELCSATQCRRERLAGTSLQVRLKSG